MQPLQKLFRRLNGARPRVEAREIDAAAVLLAAARHTIALTGAGISTASGIPDFRSPQNGLWQETDALEVASLDGFRRDPVAFYRWLRPLAERALRARPNAAHHALAKLEQHGRLATVITQNIDNLHTIAGSRHVHEIHGHMRELHCTQCGRRYESAPFMADYLRDGHLPFCDCGSILRPAVVLFGEMLPYDVLLQARHAAQMCDLLLVAGSSLSVFPAADFPAYARQTGARLIIINLTPTPFDALADVVIHGDVTDVLPRLVQAIA